MSAFACNADVKFGCDLFCLECSTSSGEVGWNKSRPVEANFARKPAIFEEMEGMEG